MLGTVRYDHVVPMGQWCGPALWLRKLGLRSVSLPFDWLLGTTLRLEDFVEIVTSGFSTFFRRENMRCVERGICEADAIDAHDHYLDSATGLKSVHDFPPRGDFETDWPRVRAKFERRVSRLLSLLASHKKLLFIHCLKKQSCSADRVRAAAECLRRTYPNSAIDLLVIEQGAGPAAAGVTEIDAGVFYAYGPYFPADGDGRYGDRTLVGPLLKQIRTRGRIRNLFRRRWLRLLFKLRTAFHLSAEARRRARRTLES